MGAFQTPLAVQTPQPRSPLTSIGALMQLRGQMSELALNQARTEQAKQQTADFAAQAAQRNRDLEDVNNYTALMKDPANQKAFSEKGDTSAFEKAGIQPKFIDAIVKSRQDRVAGAATLDKDELANRATAIGQLKETATNIAAPNRDGTEADLPTMNSRYQSARGYLTELVRKSGSDPSKLPPSIDSPDQLNQVISDLHGAEGIYNAAMARKKEQLDVTAKEDTHAAAAANLPKLQAEAEEETRKLALMKSATPDQWHAQIDKAIDPASHGPLNNRTKALVDSALALGDFKAAQLAIKDGSDQIGKTETAVASAKATEPIKISVAAAGATAKADAAGLTDDDYQRAGEQYTRTGVMPAMGRDTVTRGRIVHAANEFARANGLSPQDVTTMQAAFAGDKESLKKFQAQRDQIVSFENTAKKNLDLFVGTAQKIVDSGSPWINKPLREIDQKALGSTDIAAFNAARQVANNEIAKVTSGGGLGGVLSDSARHEVESYNPSNATLAQTLAVAKILRQDMANRHSSMDAMLGEVKGRIGGSGSSPGAESTPKATHRYNPATGQIEAVQ